MSDLRQAAQMALEAWQPIETAPKDASAILVMRDIWPGTKSGRAEECNGHNTYVAAWWANENNGEGTWVCYMDATHDPKCPVEPTHWMPLPLPPNAAPPQQQAEPVAMRMPKVGDKVICLEDESFGEVVSLTAGGSPDISFDDGSRGTYMLGEFAKLFGYVNLPQRQWVGLTDEDFLEACQIAERGNYLLAFQRIQIKLKERNNG